MTRSGRTVLFWLIVAALSLTSLLFLGIEQNTLVPGLFDIVGAYLLEIVASISAAGLTDSLMVFFAPVQKSKASIRVWLATQALVPVAGFALVLGISPEAQMAGVADSIFDAELDGCRSAALDVLPSPDAEEKCLALVKAYPFRPEPLQVLGQFTYRTSSLMPENLAKARDYFSGAFELYEVTSDEPTSQLGERFSDQQLSNLREVVYGLAIHTANADLRLYGVGCGTKEKALKALKNAQAYLVLADRMGEETTSTSFRARVKAIGGVIDLYRTYLLDGIDEEELDKVKKEFSLAAGVSSGRSHFQHYNIFVVSTIQAYLFGNEEARVEAKSSISVYIDSLAGELENPRSAVFAANIGRWLSQITNNTREDPFVVTRPVGGKKIGGSSIKEFFDDHPDIRRRILDTVAF